MATRQDLSKFLVLVVGDFRQGAPEALALRALGMRVFAAGMASAAARRQMELAGVAISGLVRSRKEVVDAAVERVGGCDAAMVVSPGWQRELEALREAERENAAMDGRGMIPILALHEQETKSRGHKKQNSDASPGRRNRA